MGGMMTSSLLRFFAVCAVGLIGAVTFPDCSFADAGVGAIQGWSYSETYTGPDEIAEGTRIYAILEIIPVVGNKRFFMTDRAGFFALSSVPVGNYVIWPLHCSSDYAVKVRVARDETSQVTVVTPRTGFYLYLINCSEYDPPLGDPNVRRALALAVDRPRVLAAAEVTDREPAFDFIPRALREGGWAGGAARISYSPGTARKLLDDTNPFDLILSYNTGSSDEITRMHGSIAARVRSSFLTLPEVRQVTLVQNSWEQQLEDLVRGHFDLLRMGWELDSNNILEFYRVYFGRGNWLNYSNPAVLELMDRAQAALEEGAIPAYEDAILTINSMLIDDMPAIPLCFY
jgi:ABC-type transport system substrate-binding protein